MKTWVLGVALLAGCSTDTQNLGDQFTFRSPQWNLDIQNATAMLTAVDGNGDVVALGGFANTVNFGTTTLDAGTHSAWWVGKRHGSDGSERWTFSLSGEHLYFWGIATDAPGNVYLAGQFVGDQDFGGQTLHSGDQQAFVAKYDADGHLLWVNGLGVSSQAMSIAAGTTGQVYIEVHQNGSFTTPQGQTITSKEAVVAYDASGAMVWAQGLPPTRVAATDDGGLMLAGEITQSQTVGGMAIDLTHEGHCFAAKLDATGNFEWLHTFGDLGVDYNGMRLAVDREGRAGVAASSMDGVPIHSLLDSSGVIWSDHPQTGRVLDQSVASYDNFEIVTGRLQDGTIDFGSGTMVGAIVLAARDASGALADAKVYGDPTLGFSAIFQIATGPQGEIAFAGSLGQPIDFGSGTLGAMSTADHPSMLLGLMGAP
jgi:hypothetical protein